ncbi:hypothetical protein ACFRMN_32245 [Streptomyces sp. NPDC056835]
MSLRKITPLKPAAKNSRAPQKPAPAKKQQPQRPQRRPIGG